MSGVAAAKDATMASILIKSADRMEAQKSGVAAVKDATMASILIKSADWMEAQG